MASLGGKRPRPVHSPASTPTVDATAKCNQRAFDKIVARPVISAMRTSRIQRGKSILGSIAAGHTQSAEPAAVRTIKSVSLFMNPAHWEDSRIERSTKELTRYRNPMSCSEPINGLFRLRAVLVVSRPWGVLLQVVVGIPDLESENLNRRPPWLSNLSRSHSLHMSSCLSAVPGGSRHPEV